MSQKALNRLMIKLTKENLWIYIVKLLMERPMYGYEIAKEIRERFNINITNVGGLRSALQNGEGWITGDLY